MVRAPRATAWAAPLGAVKVCAIECAPMSSSRPLVFVRHGATQANIAELRCGGDLDVPLIELGRCQAVATAQRIRDLRLDRKSTRLNSSHRCISYAVFCLKKTSNK